MDHKIIVWLVFVILLSGMAQAYATGICDGLVAYYDGSNTSVAVDLVNDIEGTYSNNSIHVSDGLVGDGFSFDGVTDLINITNTSLLPTDKGTFSFYVKTDSWDDSIEHVFFSTFYDGNEWLELQKSSGNILRFTLQGVGYPVVSSTVALLSKTEYHLIVFTYNYIDDDYKIYIDDSLDSTLNNAFSSVRFGDNAVMGAGYDSTNNFDGQMDGFSIWDREINLSEVITLYNGGNGTTYPSFCDTSLPVIDWLYPESNGLSTTELDRNATIRVNITDNDVYSYNITLISPTGLTVFSDSYDNLNVTSISYSRSVLINETGAYTVIVTASDELNTIEETTYFNARKFLPTTDVIGFEPDNIPKMLLLGLMALLWAVFFIVSLLQPNFFVTALTLLFGLVFGIMMYNVGAFITVVMLFFNIGYFVFMMATKR